MEANFDGERVSCEEVYEEVDEPEVELVPNSQFDLPILILDFEDDDFNF